MAWLTITTTLVLAEEHECSSLTRLNALEDALLANCSATPGQASSPTGTLRVSMHLAKCLATYEEQLQAAQRATRVQQAATRVPKCRLEGLGQNLCRAGRRLLPGTQPEMTAEAQNIYSVWMRQLARHETKDRDCARFEKFHALRWNPLVFVWAEAGTSGSWDTALVPWLRSDKNYATEWGPVAERTYYGPSEVAYVDTQGSPVPTSSSGVGADGAPKPAMYRLKRMHEVEQARTFLHATGTHLRDIMQLVEFGGGGGELEPTMRDLGFTGVHIIYDLPPMLLMQRFWIRHASLPVYTVGVDVQPDALVPRLARGRTFQVSSVSRPAHLPLVLQRTGVALKDTVFWATCPSPKRVWRRATRSVHSLKGWGACSSPSGTILREWTTMPTWYPWSRRISLLPTVRVSGVRRHTTPLGRLSTSSSYTWSWDRRAVRLRLAATPPRSTPHS